MRPPGHHAERDRGRGFCIFNNIALGVSRSSAVPPNRKSGGRGLGRPSREWHTAGVLLRPECAHYQHPPRDALSVNLGTLSEIGSNAGEGLTSISPCPQVAVARPI